MYIKRIISVKSCMELPFQWNSMLFNKKIQVYSVEKDVLVSFLFFRKGVNAIWE